MAKALTWSAYNALRSLAKNKGAIIETYQICRQTSPCLAQPAIFFPPAVARFIDASF